VTRRWVVVACIAVLLLLVVPVSADWLSGWGYRKSHVINNTGDALSDYQVMFTVNRSSGADSGSTVYVGTKCNESYDDIRFTNATGGLLDYWIEESDSSDATIWVEVDTIAASGNTTIYLYYGNSGASAVSSGDDTFEFFDDFPGSSLDTSKWDTLNSPTISISNSIITLSGSGLRGLNSDSAYISKDQHVVRARARETSGSGDAGFRVGTNPLKIELRASSGSFYNIWESAARSGSIGSGTYNTYYTVETRPTTTSIESRISDGSWYRNGWSPAIDGKVAVHTYGATVQYDWVLVRKYAATEPTHGAWGSEESPTPTPTVTPTPTGTSPVQGDVDAGRISPLGFVMLAFINLGLVLHTFVNNESRNYLHVFTGIVAVIVSFMLGTFLITGFVQEDFVVTAAEVTVNSSVLSTYQVEQVSIIDASVGYYFVFIGILMALIVILSVIEIIREIQEG